MSETINVGNFSVQCFTSPTPVSEGELISDYETTTLILVPDTGYSILASNFSAQTPLPSYVQSVSFQQSTANAANVECTVNLIPGSVMPGNDINIDLCITGSSSEANYCVAGLIRYIRSSNVVPATLNNTYDICGSYETTSNAATQSVSAIPGYYFDAAPTISLAVGSIDNYIVSSENFLDADDNIITTVFTIDYKFPNNDVSGDIWEIEAEAQIIYVPVIEITNYNINTASISQQGGSRYYSIYGSPGADWVLTATNSNGIIDILQTENAEGETVFTNTLSGTLDSTGYYEVFIVIPPSTIPQSFDLTISGDLANPFGQPVTVTLQQYANVTITYATSSNNGLTVVPGNYTKEGFTYAAYTGDSRPITSVAWTVSPSDPANILALIDGENVNQNVTNNDEANIQFTTSGTGTTHPITAPDPTETYPAVGGWKFIGQTNYSPSISVIQIDSNNNTITFDTPITVTANQTELIGNNNGNDVSIPLAAAVSEPDVIISGNIAVNQFGFADNTFTFLLDEFIVESDIPDLVTSPITNIQSGTSDSGGNSINDNYSDIIQKGVEWSQTSDFSIILGTTNDGAGTDDYTSEMTGLIEGNTYYVRAYAINTSGTGYGQTIQFLHPISVSIPTLTTVTPIAGNPPTTATSGGESILDNGGVITSKGIELSATSDFNTIIDTTNDGTGIADYISNITGLSAGNTYYVRAYAINSAGTGYGQTESFQTLAAPTISTVAISGISWDSAVSGGENISDNGTTVSSKGVEWSTTSNFATIEGSTSDGSGTANFASNLTGLSETTTYYVRAYAVNAIGTGYGQTETFQTIALPVTGLTWATTVNNPCNATPWTISQNNTRIRYDIEDSVNCGGTCNAIQSGTATAIITVGAVDVDMGLDFEGVGEGQAAAFELISFELDGTEVARANAAGGGLGCTMLPVVKTFVTSPPYRLNANTQYTFFIDFTTADALFHVGAYYEVDLSFTPVP